MKQTLYFYFLIVVTTIFCCTDDLPIIQTPQNDLPQVTFDVKSVNGGELIANIENFNDFPIIGKGFYIAIESFDCLDGNNNQRVLIDVITDTNLENTNIIVGSVKDLPLETSFFFRAFVEIKNPITGVTRIICSDVNSATTGKVSVKGFSEILEKDGIKKIRVTGRLDGLKKEDKAQNHGFVWFASEERVNTGRHPDPNTFFENQSGNIIFLDTISQNRDFILEPEKLTKKGIYYYIIPFVELDGQRVFDVDDNKNPIYQEEFIGDFWTEHFNDTRHPSTFPDGLAEAVSFSIDNIGYMGTGYKWTATNRFATATFWSYNPLTNEYQRLVNYPGEEDGRRRHAVGFSINGKGYVGTGYIGNGNLGSGDSFRKAYQDFYEYQPSSSGGIWRKLTDFPYPVWGAVSFVIDDKAYVGTGWKCDNETGGCSVVKDLYQFNPEEGLIDSSGLPMGKWIAMSTMPTTSGRAHAIGFAINNKGYIATGVIPGNNGGHSAGVYEFTPDNLTGSWKRKDNFSGAARQKAVSFVIREKAYITMGSNATVLGNFATFNDLWEYDSRADIWTQKSDVDEFNMDSATSFTIDAKGYLYGGFRAREFASISFNMRIYTPELLNSLD